MTRKNEESKRIEERSPRMNKRKEKSKENTESKTKMNEKQEKKEKKEKGEKEDNQSASAQSVRALSGVIWDLRRGQKGSNALLFFYSILLYKNLQEPRKKAETLVLWLPVGPCLSCICVLSSCSSRLPALPVPSSSLLPFWAAHSQNAAGPETRCLVLVCRACPGLCLYK